MKKPVAAISMYRNAPLFVDKWISFYAEQLGHENLYLFVDGLDQPLPKEAEKIHCFQIPHKSFSRAKGDRFRAKKISTFAQSLFPKYSAVIAMDIDEFLVVDPKLGLGLKAYLQQQIATTSCSALGLDVGQHPQGEKPIDLKKPFLSQRRFAQISDRYTKAVVIFEPLEWGSGFHRVKGKDFVIDSNLFLFHFGLVDYTTAANKSKDKELNQSGWKGHFNRRMGLYEALEEETPQDADPLFLTATKYFTKNRRWLAWNKPATLKGPSVIKIPKRFEKIV